MFNDEHKDVRVGVNKAAAKLYEVIDPEVLP